jgi:hypothetical protein
MGGVLEPVELVKTIIDCEPVIVIPKKRLILTQLGLKYSKLKNG